jgi:hypothetical protein
VGLCPLAFVELPLPVRSHETKLLDCGASPPCDLVISAQPVLSPSETRS